jgi:hypothetical protein
MLMTMMLIEKKQTIHKTKIWKDTTTTTFSSLFYLRIGWTESHNLELSQRTTYETWSCPPKPVQMNHLLVLSYLLHIQRFFFIIYIYN